MAKIVPGPTVAGLKGKIGGTIFQSGRYGYTARQNYIPYNPKSAVQNTQRGRLRTIAREWGTLTKAQQASWSQSPGDLVQAPKRKKIFATNTLSPYAFFVQTNSYRVLVGLTQLATYAGKGAVYSGSVTSFNRNIGFDDWYLQLEQNAVRNTFVIFYLTLPQSQGITNYSGRYLFAGYHKFITTGLDINVTSSVKPPRATVYQVGQNAGFKAVFVSANGNYVSTVEAPFKINA